MKKQESGGRTGRGNFRARFFFGKSESNPAKRYTIRFPFFFRERNRRNPPLFVVKNDPPASAFRAKLRACVAEELDAHWRQLDGGKCRNLRALVINSAEEELLDFAMRRADHNQIRAAKILGVSRSTLIRKLRDHPALHSHFPRARPSAAKRAAGPAASAASAGSRKKKKIAK